MQRALTVPADEPRTSADRFIRRLWICHLPPQKIRGATNGPPACPSTLPRVPSPAQCDLWFHLTWTQPRRFAFNQTLPQQMA